MIGDIIHLFKRYLLSTYSVPDPLLGTGDMAAIQANEIPLLKN